MSESKKRRWLQWHLSTCIVLMFVASGILWVNVRPTKNPVWEGTTQNFLEAYGWPLTYFFTENGELTLIDYAFGGIEHDPRDKIFWTNAGINVIVFLLFMGTTACACEYSIRRRKARLLKDPDRHGIRD